jgi:hypothetical protein
VCALNFCSLRVRESVKDFVSVPASVTLNTKVRVNPDGTLKTAWYTKQANKGILIHALSHHPKSMKVGAIQHTLKTISLISSDNNLKATAESEFRNRTIRNGYACSRNHHNWQSKDTQNKKNHQIHQIDKTYISDQLGNGYHTDGIGQACF